MIIFNSGTHNKTALSQRAKTFAHQGLSIRPVLRLLITAIMQRNVNGIKSERPKAESINAIIFSEQIPYSAKRRKPYQAAVWVLIHPLPLDLFSSLLYTIYLRNSQIKSQDIGENK